jgi:hypothetical protein
MTRSFVGVSPCHLAEAGELVARVAFAGDPSEAFGLPFYPSRCGDRTIVVGVRGATDEVRAVELVGP